MKTSKLVLLMVILLAVAGFFYFDLSQYLQLSYLKTQQASLDATITAHPFTAFVGFFLLYIAVTALALPGAAVMTLGAGALFGLGWGTLLVSFASTMGATLNFLAARYFFRDSLRAKYAQTLKRFDEGVERDGAFYLASLRLVPFVPFVVINPVMGLTALHARTFYLTSQIFMLPGTLVYVNAGTQLAKIDSLQGILSLPLLLSFTLLGTFPFIAKFIMGVISRRRLYAPFQRPQRFDYNLLVIGGGAAGLVSAYIGAAVKAKVALIEKHKMGGDCLNTGCVPSKALIRSARVAQLFREADRFGLQAQQVQVPFNQVMERVQRVVAQVEPHDSVERYSSLGVECLQGEARLLSPWEVEVQGAGRRRLTSKAIIIASGGRPFVPPIPGLAEMQHYTSDTIWELRERPGRLLILGGGPIGCELAQAFARLGSQVIQVEMLERLLMREDEEVSRTVLQRFQAEGIDVKLGHKALQFKQEAEQKLLVCEHQGEQVSIPFDVVLVAVGRAANSSNLGLENLGITPNRNGTLPVAEDMSVRYPNVFACGDVAGPYQFTHTAAHQAWYAAVNALFGRFRRYKADYSVIPWVTFTDPEVARVGLNEQDAKAQGIAYEVTHYGLDDLDRAIAESAAHGFIKVLTPPGKDRILGVTIVGEHAGELLAEFVLAMRHGLGLNKILGTIHAYPTWNEAVKYIAGEWKKAHAPQRVLGWLERYHRWQRG